MNHKKYLFVLISLLIFFLGGISVFIYSVDPIQIHSVRDTYVGDQRYEIAGIAKNHDYDAAIIGSSMCMNHYPSQIDSLWGWKTRNFTMMGITHDEYNILLPYLIRQGKLKNIIFGIDLFSLQKELGAIPSELYDDNPINDFTYLLSYQGIKQSIQFLTNPNEEYGLYHFTSPTGIDKVRDAYNDALKQKNTPFDYEKNIAAFENHIFRHISESPNTLFWYIYFPPYSIGEFSLYEYRGQLDPFLKLKEYVIKKLSKLPNVVVYDFQREDWITDLNQYMDLRHHSHSYNRQIIEAIRNHQYIINLDNINAANQYLKELAREYCDSLL